MRAPLYPQQRVLLLLSSFLPGISALLLGGSVLLLLPLPLLLFGVQVGVAAVVRRGTLVCGGTAVTRLFPSVAIGFAPPRRLCFGEILEDLDLCVCVGGDG